MNTIEISPEELGLIAESGTLKLPTDSIHNHLHAVSEGAKVQRAQLEGIELSALILCAVELEELKKVNHGLPWKEWVKSNCDFSYMTATKYARVLKSGRAGRIPNLLPESIPETAPSAMSAEDLRDACQTLAASLEGLGGIRQLYLELEIITNGKQSKISAPNDSQEEEKTAVDDLSIAEEDAITTYRQIIEDLDRAKRLNQLQHLPTETRAEIAEDLQAHLKILTA